MVIKDDVFELEFFKVFNLSNFLITSKFVKLNLSQYNVPIFDATGSDFIDDAERI